MIGALQGTVFQSRQNPLIIMAGGVGYAVQVPEKILAAVHEGETVLLHVHTHVRDDAIELYGFRDHDELRLFELLIAVSGIGPRTALLIVNRGVGEIEKAIRSADVDFFITIPRLGKKNAQKIIIDLKSKLGSLEELDLKNQGDSETKQIADALAGMGFGRTEILSALKQFDDSDRTVEQKLRHALQFLAKQTV